MLRGAVVSAVLCLGVLRAGAWSLSPGAATPQLRSGPHVLLAASKPGVSSAAKVALTSSDRKARAANASDTVHVAYSATRQLLPAALRSMLSLSLHNSAPHLTIHLFVPESDIQASRNLSQCFQQQLDGADLRGGMPELQIEPIREMTFHLNNKRFDHGADQAAQGRLFLHEWLPQVHRVVYLDTDTLVFGDVSELYAKSMSHAAAVAFHPPDTLLKSLVEECPYFAQDASERMIQDGVMLLDLDRWRSQNMTGTLEEMARTHPCAARGDQKIVNAVLWSRGFDRFDSTWNKLGVGPKLTASEIFHYKIAHFTGDTKPWYGTADTSGSPPWFFETFRAQWNPEGSTADDGGHCVGFPL